MSAIAIQVQNFLETLFPSKPIKQVFCERYVKYKGHKLFFDFYIKSLDVFVEVQGRQHTEFVKHFHGERETFLQQRERDNLKRIWVEENGHHLIRFYSTEDITEGLILDKISRAIDSEDGFCE